MGRDHLQDPVVDGFACLSISVNHEFCGLKDGKKRYILFSLSRSVKLHGVSLH
jgi:hypothetical protein